MLDHSIVKVPERFRDHPIFNQLICGTNFGFMSKRGYYDREDVLKQPELMKKAGINWCTLHMNFCQTKYSSEKLFLDFEFSTGELEIAEMVKRLHDNGIRILFKPCLIPLDGAWMGTVNFPVATDLKLIQGVHSDYWGNWFRSFMEAEKYFASLAERLGMDALIIGAELFGTEGQNEYWEQVIAEIRKRYSRPITYEFIYDSRKKYDLNWFKKLDFLSYSYYPPASDSLTGELTEEAARMNPTYTVNQMSEYLESRKSKIASICERFDNMPILFTEYGMRSSHGCILQPANFQWDTPYDGEEQANYMDASFQTFWNLPQWMGFCWWKWDETQDRPHYQGDPGGDRGFTIQGKPAEQVMQKWVQKNK